jgi:hypothetical protein
MHLIAVLLGLLAFIALGMNVLFANIMFGMILFAGVGVIVWLEVLDLRRTA